ncbi:hypothetical protein D9M68_793200 [compost metagenome]
MIWLVSAGQTFFNAGGSTTCRKVCMRESARLAAASNCPLGVASMPARMISAAYAPRLITIAMTDAISGVSFTPAAGRPKNTKNSCTMKGVLRISST